MSKVNIYPMKRSECTRNVLSQESKALDGKKAIIVKNTAQHFFNEGDKVILIYEKYEHCLRAELISNRKVYWWVHPEDVKVDER